MVHFAVAKRSFLIVIARYSVRNGALTRYHAQSGLGTENDCAGEDHQQFTGLEVTQESIVTWAPI
jgi:hypothetical protein